MGWTMPLASHKLNAYVDASRLEWCNKVQLVELLETTMVGLTLLLKTYWQHPITECMVIVARIRSTRSRKIQNIKMESDAIQVSQAIKT